MNKINWKALLASLAISLGAGVIASLLTRDSMQQYGELYQPPQAPPGWLFPIVWTILFVFMGIAAYLVYVSDAETDEKRSALKVYGVQLLANIGWSVIFFRFNGYTFAFFWLILLWYLIYITRKHFAEIDVRAGYLLLPYLLWVTFAGYLNLAIALYYR